MGRPLVATGPPVRLSDLLARLPADEAVLEAASRDIAHALLRVRGQHKLTQAGLAAAVGESQRYVSQLESGAANPSARSLAALLMAAGYQLRLTIEPLEGGPIPMPDGKAQTT